jgi:E3 ubiquitin-protein ligase UBR2
MRDFCLTRALLKVGMSPNASEDTSCFHPISYNVQSQPVSLHIPLHRFVSFFLSQLGRHVGTDILHSVFPSRSYVLSFIEHPLRVQVLLAQIRAGIWRWNGETMLRRAWFYRSSYFYDFGFDLDLFILQTAASLLDPETFLVTLLHRFNLVSVFGFKSPRNPERDGYDDGVNWSAVQEPFVPTIVEDLLVLVGAIVGERARLGYTDKECIEQEVIARLCVRPHAHSQLTDNICRRWHEHDNFEGVLNGVAVYEPPKSDKMEQGKYKLKNEYMGQEQKHLIHILVRSFNHGDYEAAMGLSKSNQVRCPETLLISTLPRAIPDYFLTLLSFLGAFQRPEDGASSSTSTGDRNGADKQEERLIQPAKGLFQRLGLLLESRVLHQVY